MRLCREFLSWLLPVCLLIAWLSPSAAFAQDEKARARELFAAGVERFESGDYRGALNAFESAYRLAPHPAVRVNMANCFEQLGRPTEAVFNFRRFLEEAGDSVDAAQRAEVEKTIARLEARIGTLSFTMSPSDASLRIDGTVPRLTPQGTVRLGEGRYRISVSAPGYVTEEQEVLVTGGMEQALNISLERDHAQMPSASAQSVVTEQEEFVEPPPESDGEESTRSSPLLWVAAGTTATLAVGFAITGGLAIKSQNEFDDAVERSNNTTLPSLDREAARKDGLDASDRASTLAIVSDVMLAGSVVAGGATLLIWLTNKHRDDSKTSLRAGPLLLRRGAGGGFVLGGKF